MGKFNSDLIERNYVYVRLKDDEDGSPHFSRRERRVIVCLCGSTRFYEPFQKANYEETMAGRIVLSVGHYPNYEGRGTPHGEAVGCTPEQKVLLDLLHLEKIDLADEVLVLNVNGYVGDSTRREVLHAHKHGKTIRWLQPAAVPPDLCHIGNSTVRISH